MPSYDFDYFVIGAGSGGVRSARIAAQHGARVGIAEERYLGGTCVNVGCVPKKLLAYGAQYGPGFADAAGYGWSVGEPRHDWKTLIANKDKEIARLNGIYRRLLEGAGATVFDARAVLEDAHTIRMGDQRVTADKILIATGGWPNLPDEPGAREHGITSNEVFHLEEMPKRVIIAGGGYIGVEFASIFNGLGAEVTLLYRNNLFLRGFDRDVRQFMADELTKTGIDIRFSTILTRLARSHDGLVAELSDETLMEADQVLYAIGRTPNTKGLGLEAAGVEVDESGAVKIDDAHRTTAENIYAVGDVTERVPLTPVAIAEGHALADTLFGGMERRISYANIPSAVFSNPQIACVGLTEEAARARHDAVDVYNATFRPMRHTMSGREERSFMKLVVERESQKVLGVHIVGEDAAEMVQGFAVALNCGATKQDFDRTIGLHPTSAEELVTMRIKAPDPEAAEAAD